jgi:hypothetical protein
MPSAAQLALTRGHDALFAAHGEVGTWGDGTRQAAGVRQVQSQPGLDGRGTVEETVFVVRRATVPAPLPEVGEPFFIDGIEHRLVSLRPGQMPGTIALVLEEVLR